MSFIHDVIKRQYVYEGYLPNYPYHLISDDEMFDAFIKNTDVNYFDINYPRDLFLSDSEMSAAYDNLKQSILGHIDAYLTKEAVVLPNWVYSYMLGTTISVNSDKRDIHDLLVMLGTDNMDDEFNLISAKKCLQISIDWIKKLNLQNKSDNRPPSMFGEPHVIKSLRLNPIVFI